MFTHPETEERIFSEVETLMNVLRSIVNQNCQQALGYLENRKNINLKDKTCINEEASVKILNK